jgi:hypothetical protein
VVFDFANGAINGGRNTGRYSSNQAHDNSLRMESAETSLRAGIIFRNYFMIS